MWQARVVCDLIRGGWHDGYHTYLTIERYTIIASRNGTHYQHFYIFYNDKEGADKFCDKINAHPNFSPEGKKDIWAPVVDTKEYAWKCPRDWRWLLNKLAHVRR